MITPQVPTPAGPVPVFTSRQVVVPPVATVGAHVRRRQRGGLIVDLDDTLYSREQFVLGGLAAVARHVAAKFADHKGPRRNSNGSCATDGLSPDGCGADLPPSPGGFGGHVYGPRKGAISADAAFTVLINAYDGDQRGRELQVLCRHFELPSDVIPELVTVFREHRPSLWLRPGVVDALQRLRRDGWRIVILTNGLPAVQASKVAALEVARFVDGVLYAEQFALGGKPAPATFQAALAQLNLPAGSCICVGDDPTCDIRGGRGAGLRTIRIARSDVRVPSRHEADAVIDRFEDVPSAAVALLNLVNVDVA